MPDIKAQNETALASVKAIYDAADEANTLLDGMQTAAAQAGTTLNGIYADAESAKSSAENASEYASRALGNLASVQSVTETLNWITAHGTMTLTSDVALDPSHVYFVVDANGDYVVGGTHYSVVSEPVLADIGSYYELSINESLNNYVATHLVVDTEGLWIIPDSGGNKVLIATGSGSTYTTAGTYIVGASGTLASFTATGAIIGQNVSGQSRAVITADGMQVYRGESGTDAQIVNLGYGLGNNEQGGQSYAPYTTLGTRLNGSVVGNYSVAEGRDVVASGALSHAEGMYSKTIGSCSHAEGAGAIASGGSSHAEGGDCTASGFVSHAEGNVTIASGEGAHAEGTYCVASGDYSHAEGRSTHAEGLNSHAQNYYTIASQDNQTALGKYNLEDVNNKYAVIVGNGTGTSARSNALTVDWSGNVVASGSVDGTDITASGDITSENAYLQLDTTATSGTDKEIYDALVSLGWDSDVIV